MSEFNTRLSEGNETYGSAYARAGNQRALIEALEKKSRALPTDIGFELSEPTRETIETQYGELQAERQKEEAILRKMEIELSSFAQILTEETSDNLLSEHFVQHGEIRKLCERRGRSLNLTDYLLPTDPRCFTCAI
jgi:hypothetical protein